MVIYWKKNFWHWVLLCLSLPMVCRLQFFENHKMYEVSSGRPADMWHVRHMVKAGPFFFSSYPGFYRYGYYCIARTSRTVVYDYLFSLFYTHIPHLQPDICRPPVPKRKTLLVYTFIPTVYALVICIHIILWNYIMCIYSNMNFFFSELLRRVLKLWKSV